MEELKAVIRPDHVRTRMLVTHGAEEVLKAVLAAPGSPHGRAASTLLEGLALWFQQPVRVLLTLEDLYLGAALGLCDKLGFGHRTLHYDVDVRRPAAPHLAASLRLGGCGDFRQLRRHLRLASPGAK